jgi:formylglycine-generating enzyme required for sulfatase activity
MGQADERADIYALGIVLYEMITGRIPFRADTPMAILLKKNQEPLPRLKQFVSGLPESVENVLIKALARDPQNRYQTTQEFLNALTRLSRGEEIASVRTTERRINPVWVFGGVGVLAVLLICGIGIFAAFKFLAADSQPSTPDIVVTQPDSVDPSYITPAAWTESPVPPLVFDATITSVPPPIIDPTVTPGPVSGQTSINPVDQAEIVFIPASTFEMGLSNSQRNVLQSKWKTRTILLEQSQPQHSVTLNSYWIYKTEVSNAMYQQCVQAGMCLAPVQGNSATRGSYYGNKNFDDYPVVFVTWQMSETYCEWAGGGLPTEAQWEYAARGPDGNLFPWGNNAWSKTLANVKNSQIGDTTPVDDYQAGASPFGLLNMSGNVWEWVFDWYRDDYYRTNSNWIDPIGPESGKVVDGLAFKSVRGGAYWNPAGDTSIAIHDWERAVYATMEVGFRCAMNP